MGVQFKDIEIRELTAEPEFADRFSAHPAPAPVPQLTDAALAGAIKTGEKIYAERCAACHSVSQSGAPPKETLEQLPHQKIVDMLVTGAMQPQASGLGDAEINALAVYLTSFAKAR